jgi:hypothetical protein
MLLSFDVWKHQIFVIDDATPPETRGVCTGRNIHPTKDCYGDIM